MAEQDEQKQDPAPIEPGHVMSREKYRKLVKEQTQK
jgi:hypothetical protein